ncbi:unnamed protein product [Rotaria socialis]|uniref:F-box domain-containing protein n=2 Tax=Rotaria socialis TaxID=392032 RepID=A0A817NLC5_9BILA|nr:unnamed protein product [Rotaria socialis]CAF4228624.1 unnamed protein product [Rotaria socialis]CAF4328510.1 unnamed protein product [Rotaria socialis]
MTAQSHVLHCPNELIYCCFGYLSFSEILRSFSDLNSRFIYLINTHWSSIEIDNDLRQSRFRCLLQNLKPSQVCSLRLLAMNDERDYTHQSFKLFSIENFENLQSLRLNNISQQTFPSLIFNLHQLRQLSKLVIFDSPDDDNQLIFEQLFLNRIPKLKSLALDFILHYEPDAASTDYNYSSSNIEVLALHCYVDNANFFLKRTPMLKN